MEEPLNIAQFKEKLKQELARLESELPSVGQRNPDNPADWQASVGDIQIDTADKNEVADKFEEMVGNNAIMNELETQYNEVKAALKRIEDGIYGVCEKGGEQISEKRLEAFPAARTCVEHMEPEG